MSQEQTQQVKVTLEELILTQKDVEQFYILAEDMPHKYAKQMLGLLESKVKEQLEAKVAKLQAEYNEKQLELAKTRGEVEGLKTGLKAAQEIAEVV